MIVRFQRSEVDYIDIEGGEVPARGDLVSYSSPDYLTDQRIVGDRTTPMRVADVEWEVYQTNHRRLMAIVKLEPAARAPEGVERRLPAEMGPNQAPAPWNDPRRFWCDACGSAWGVDRAVEAARAEACSHKEPTTP